MGGDDRVQRPSKEKKRGRKSTSRAEVELSKGKKEKKTWKFYRMRLTTHAQTKANWSRGKEVDDFVEEGEGWGRTCDGT